MSDTTGNNTFSLARSPPHLARTPSGTIVSRRLVIHGARCLCKAAAAGRTSPVQALRRRWQRARRGRPGSFCGGGVAAAKRAAFAAALATLHRGGNEEASSGGLVARTSRRLRRPPPAASLRDRAITASIHMRFQTGRPPCRLRKRPAGCLRAMPVDAARLRGEAAARAFDDAARTRPVSLTIGT